MSEGFGLDHLPYGVFSTEASSAAGRGPLRRLGRRRLHRAARARPAVAERLHGARARARGPTRGPRSRPCVAAEALAALPLDSVALHLPFTVGDYVDFYASLDHASNVGRIFRPDQEPLLPNWRHLPVGYHGRGGTVVVSGTPVIRPCGQRKAPHDEAPTYGPSGRLDIEAELGFVVGVGSELGSRIGVDEFQEHVFGVVGLNDWSARDIQAWEYVPLGPFLGKSFATSVSAWVTPLAALAAARDRPAGAGSGAAPLPGLERRPTDARLDIDVEVVLNGEVVSRPPYRTMYWSPAQMLAHLTVNGASTRTGDLFASGTISGPEPDQRGSFLELSWGGKEPFARRPHLPRGRRRGHPALLRARHRRWPDHARRGHRAGSSPRASERGRPRPRFLRPATRKLGSPKFDGGGDEMYGRVTTTEALTPSLVRVVLEGGDLADLVMPDATDAYINAAFRPGRRAVRRGVRPAGPPRDPSGRRAAGAPPLHGARVGPATPTG